MFITRVRLGKQVRTRYTVINLWVESYRVKFTTLVVQSTFEYVLRRDECPFVVVI
jgi:hypothetical protein